MQRVRGFSLLEVLVMLVIIGVLVAAVSLSLGGSASRQLQNTAQQAEALIKLACDRASLSGSDIGIQVRPDRLVFGFFDDLGWHPLTADSGDSLRPRALGDAIQLQLRRDGQPLTLNADAQDPQLACLGSGELTPFALILSRNDVTVRWRLQGHANGALDVERIDAFAR